MRSSFSGACIALLALPLLATAPSLAADADQDADDGITLLGDRLPFNTELMAHLTDPQENVVGEVPFILRAKQSGEIKPLSITIGGFFNGTYLFERTDTLSGCTPSSSWAIWARVVSRP